MPARENLFQLVKLLTADEEKFFIRYLGKYKGSESVLRLFKDLRQGSHFKPGELEKKHNSLRVLKSKLKKELLEAMRVKRLKSDAENKIFCHIKDYRFFYEKGFLFHGSKSLEAAKELAIEYEKTGLLMLILKEEMRIRMELNESTLKDEMELLIEKSQTALDTIVEETQAINTYYRLFLKSRSGDAKTDLKERPYREVKAEESFESRFYKLNANTVHASLKRNYPEARSYVRQLVEQYRAHDQIRQEQIVVYKRLLGNHATLSFALGDFGESLSLVQEIKLLPIGNLKDEAEVFASSALVQLLWALNHPDQGPFSALVDELMEGTAKFETQINLGRRLSLWYNLSWLCFFEDDFEKSRLWMDKILKHKRFKVKQKDIFGIRISQLLLEYEEGNMDLLEFSLTNAKAFFRRNKILDEYSRGVFRMFSAILKSNLKSRGPVFESFLEELEDLSKAEITPSVSGFWEVRRWVEEKANLPVA